ncbi:hypothetical protein WMY93_016647 [Mugilogobius chulae]|uniref:THD domain-containing protein n=1 Tax=Mugilogobius chulae TaxID=88201 RepID=A0AAW0NQT7_9GOBI
MAVFVSPQCLGMIILGAVLIQTIAVSVSFMYFSKALSTMKESFSRSSVSCLMNSSPPSGLQDSAAEGKKNDPCWQVTQQLRSHIEKAMTDKFQNEISKSMKSELTAMLPLLRPAIRGVPLPKVAAHVTGVASPSESSAAAEGSRGSKGYLGERIRAWEGQRGLSFLLNMELKGGELLVPKAGLYYIYAQTYFRLPSTGEAEAEHNGEARTRTELSWSNELLHGTHSPDEVLPECVLAPGQESGLFSLHQAGTAFLQPADRLFITVSNASTLEMDGRASYFGAFLVG